MGPSFKRFSRKNSGVVWRQLKQKLTFKRALLSASLAGIAAMLAATPAIAQQGCRPMQWSQADLRRISHVPFPMGEQRRVVALLSCSQDLVISVAADRDLSARRLNAALAAFAFRNPNLTAAQLPGAIAALAGEIETLNDLLETANERIATLENAALRRSAQAELIHIQSLLDAGDLVGVVAAFTELRTLQSLT